MIDDAHTEILAHHGLLLAIPAFAPAIVGAMLWGVAFGPYILGIALAGGLVALRWRRA